MKELYLSLADYAKREGITEKQATAKLKSPQYRDFVKTNNGNILVSFGIFEIEKPSPAQAPKEEKKETIQAPADDEKERLRKEIESLKQIISEKDKQIANFALKFAELAQQAQQIAGQAQVLHLTEKAGAKEIEAPQRDEEATQIVKTQESDTDNKPLQEEKQGFFKRLFRRR